MVRSRRMPSRRRAGTGLSAPLDLNHLRLSQSRRAVDEPRRGGTQHHPTRRGDRFHSLCHSDMLADSGVTQRPRDDFTGDHLAGVRPTRSRNPTPSRAATSATSRLPPPGSPMLPGMPELHDPPMRLVRRAPPPSRLGDVHRMNHVCEEHRHLLVLRRLSGPCEWRATRPTTCVVHAGIVSPLVRCRPSNRQPSAGWLAPLALPGYWCHTRVDGEVSYDGDSQPGRYRASQERRPASRCRHSPTSTSERSSSGNGTTTGATARSRRCGASRRSPSSRSPSSPGFPAGAGHWALTTFDDVHHASRHPEIFSSIPTSTALNDVPAEIAEFFGLDDHP